MGNENIVVLTGPVGAKPRSYVRKDGRTILTFQVKQTERRRPGTAEEQRVEIWYPVKVMNDQAPALARSLAVGDHVYIRGQLSYLKPPRKDGPPTAAEVLVSGHAHKVDHFVGAPAPTSRLDDIAFGPRRKGETT